MINKIFSKINRPRVFYICQVGKDFFKILQYAVGREGFLGLTGVYEKEIDFRGSDEVLQEKMASALKSCGYTKEPFILALSGYYVTSRALKVPTLNPSEIIKMASFQASRYLPYAAEDLVSGFEVIHTDPQGYSFLNLIIVPKNFIMRYLTWFSFLKDSFLAVSLYSRGLVRLYSWAYPGQNGLIMILDVEPRQAELVITQNGKILYSRHVEINKLSAQWKEILAGQILKTMEGFHKEISKETITKIICCGSGETVREVKESLSQQDICAVETMTDFDTFKMSESSRKALMSTTGSFAGLIGLALEKNHQELNFLPRESKKLHHQAFLRREYIKMTAPVLLALALIVVGAVKIMHNQNHRLQNIDSEISRISKEARVYEFLEKRSEFLVRFVHKEPNALDAFYEIYRMTPAEVALTSFNFERESGIAIKGQAGDLSIVFRYAARLENAPELKKYKVKIGYALKRQVAAAEIVDFEIVCQKIKDKGRKRA